MRIKHNTFFFFFLIGFCFSSCTNKLKETKPNTIVLFFKNAPNQNKFLFPNGQTSGILPMELISYVDCFGEEKNYSPLKNNDTLRIRNIKSEYCEIMHKYNGIERLYYLFKTGDTIQFLYNKDSYPVVNSRTSKQLTDLYNFQSSLNNRVYKFKLESYSLLRCGFIRMLNKIKIEEPDIYNSVFKESQVNFVDINNIKKAFDTYIQTYQQSLDSLCEGDSLSQHYIDYYKYLLQHKIIASKCIDNKYSEDNNNVEIENIYLNFFDDNLTNCISYTKLLKDYLYINLSTMEKFPIIKEDNGAYHDYRQIFDYLIAKDKIPHKTKYLLLYYCLESIIDNFSKEDIQTYLQKYEEYTCDNTRVKYLIKKHNLYFTSSKDLLLTDPLGNKTSLQEVIAGNKGNLIYIDFWASWCAPCLNSLPKAELLREEYKNENVSFIYLAKNDTKEAWLKASKKYNLIDQNGNYLITNSKVSDYLEKLKVNTIPRYILLDQDGQLIHRNAPGPGSDEIRELFNELLDN